MTGEDMSGQTEFIITDRGSGKTHRLLKKMLEEDDLYYIAHSAQAADDAFERCLEIADADDIPITPEQERALRSRFVRYNGPGMPSGRRFVIDNAELLLARMLGFADIVTITATGTPSRGDSGGL